MAMVVFSGSGYGTDTHFYKGRKEATDAIEREVQEMAVDRGCDPKKMSRVGLTNGCLTPHWE